MYNVCMYVCMYVCMCIMFVYTCTRTCIIMLNNIIIVHNYANAHVHALSAYIMYNVCVYCLYTCTLYCACTDHVSDSEGEGGCGATVHSSE